MKRQARVAVIDSGKRKLSKLITQAFSVDREAAR
jgi:hypothetical protein